MGACGRHRAANARAALPFPLLPSGLRSHDVSSGCGAPGRARSGFGPPGSWWRWLRRTWLSWPAYRSRPDFTLERDFAHQLFASRDLVDMFDWIRTNTTPGDVILAREDLSLAVIGTAGRKVVAVERLFSNPFVDWDTRIRDRDCMVAALDRADANELMRLASEYRVRYAIRDTPLETTDALRCCVAEAWSSGPWRIYRIGSP